MKSVFSDERLDYDTFAKRVARKGGIHILSDGELEALSARNADLLEELDFVRNESKIELVLSQNRAKNIKAARAMLDDSCFFDENGLNEELLASHAANIRNENPWLFEGAETSEKGVSTFLPRGRAAFKDASRMSDEEYYKNILKGDTE